MKSRSALAVALFLFLSFTAAAAEVVTVVDTDHNAATGCIVRGYSGIDAVATTRVDNTPSGVIVSFVRLQRCVAGSLGPAIELPAGWRVPSDGAVQHVESAIPYAALGIDRTTPARYAFVLVQDPALPLVIPADGSMLTFNAETRRRSAAPAYEGTLPKADGLLDDWKSFQNRASAGRVDVWMQAGIDALVLRFDIRSAGGPQATDDDYVVPVAGTLNIGAPGVLANDSDPDGDPLTAQLVTPASHGIVSLETDGSFVYQHDGTSAPFDSFTYRASDGLTTSDAATVSITPVVVNERPVGSDDHYSTTEDQVLNVAAPGVLANDSDPDGDPLTATLLSGPASGTLNLQSDGSFTYTPAANFNGSVTFLYTVSDGSLVSEPVVVTIDITAVNDAPSFNAGGDVTVFEDSGAYSAAWASAISAGPAETQTLSFEITNNSDPSLFSVLPALSATGVLTFTPAADANGSATITIRLHDDGGTANGGADTSATTTFTINVNAVNDPPSFVLPATASAVDEDSGAQTVNNFTTSISAGPADESAQTLTFGVTQTSASSTLTFVVAPAIAADGTLTYTPAANAFGTATFNVVLTDSGTGTNTTAAQSFTITINAINDAPSFAIASNPPVSNEDGGAQTVNNFTTSISQGPNESGQALTFSLTPTGTTGTLTFASTPVIAADGTLTYTASANTSGTATFSVMLTDDGSNVAPNVNASGAQSFTITVDPINDAPSFTMPPNAPAVDEDSGAQTVNNFTTSISAGPADEAAQTLAFNLTQTAISPSLSFTVYPAIAPDGTLMYTPAPNAYGTVTFDVTLTDSGSNVAPNVNTSVTQSFTITVNAINDAPSYMLASNPPVSNEDGGPQTINNFATSISQGPNETGQTLTFLVTPDGSTGTLTFASAPAIAADGTLTYTASANTAGTATFLVVLTDSGSNVVPNANVSGTQAFTITVDPVNDAPSFTMPANAPAVDEDSGAQTVNNFTTSISAGPADEAGQTLTFSVTQTSASPTLTFAVAPAIAANGTLTYTPAANAYGTATFNVVLTDNGSNIAPNVNTSAAQSFTITINAINDAPSYMLASNPPVSNEDGGPQTVSAFATSISQGPNETGQTLTFTVTPDGSTGTLTFASAPAIAADGTLTYTASANTAGTATFLVVLTDSGSNVVPNANVSGTQAFTITVDPVNDAPSFTMPANAPAVNEDSGAQTVNNFTTSISAGPADESGQTLTFSVTQTSASPTLTFAVAPAIAANGTLTYTPAANAYGTATFNVVLTDNGSNIAPNVNKSAPQSFTITINAINDAPSYTIASNPPLSYEDGGAQTINNFATSISQGPNETGQTLTFTVTPDGSTGTLTFASAPAIAADGTLTYTASANTAGTATFLVVLTDSGSNIAPNVNVSGQQLFTITVDPVNDAPSFTMPANAPAVDEDSGAQTVNSFTTSISAGPADEAGQTLTFTVTQTSADPSLTFTVAPSIAANGTLTYTPAANAYGTATFSVTLSDDGSNVAPNVNTSAAQTLTITVNPINDAPSYTIGGNPPVSNEDGGAQSVNGFATSISQGANESGQTLTFTVTPTGTTGTLAFASAPAIAANGTLTYTAAANTSGTATFNVVLTDDGSNVAPNANASGTQSFTITVDPVNDAPSFTMPASAPAVNEDSGAQTVNSFTTSISAGPADEAGQTLTFTVTQTSADPSLTFTVAPSIAANGTLTYTPAANAFGSATFSVVLTDDGSNVAPNVNTSAPQSFTITVNAQNDAPVAANDNYSYPTGGGPLVVAAPGVLANDSDIDSPGLTATLVTNVAEGTLSLQPDGSFTYTKAVTPTMMTLTFTYTATDGFAVSNTATVTIALNSPPVAADDTYSMSEDGYLTASAPGLLTNDSDAENNIVLVQLVSGPNCAGYAADSCGSLGLALMQDGSFFYQPPVDFNGTMTFTYKLIDDGGLESAPATVTVNVAPVNDAPTFDVITVDASGAQNSGVIAVPFATNIRRGPATAVDEATQNLTFETEIYLGANLLLPFVDVDSGTASTTGVYIDSNGTLRFRPGASTGTVHLSVRLVDDGGTDNGGVDVSDTIDLTIRITAVFINKAPSFNVTNLTVNEDAAAQSVANWVTSISPGAGEGSQTVTMSIDSYTNPSLFAVAPTIVSNNRLTYTLAANATGTSTLTVKAQDNGGTANGGVDTLTKNATITVNAVNDAPSFVKGADLSYGSGTTGLQTVSGWATSISAGPADESAQTLTFSVALRGASIFTGTPAIASNGTLTFTLNGTTGLAYLDVRLSDNGGTANGGVNQSAIQTFTINAGNVNSPPSFVKGSNITVLEDSGLATYAGWATAISPGPAADAGQSIAFTVVAATPALFSTQPTVNAAGDLSFVPAANQFGTTNVTVQAIDDGGTTGGGVNSSDIQTFTITITGVNDAPTLSIPSASVSGGENGGARSIANFATATAGPNETGQTPFTYTVVQTGGSASLFDTGNGGVAPAISSTGTLTFTTALNQSGSATFSVTVRDAGGTANSGVDTSAAQSFTITISTGGPTVPGGNISFNAYANIPITIGAVAGEASYNLLTGASDPDLPLSVLISSKPNNARVDVAADGSFTFRSGDLAYSGGAIQPQSFKWRVCDSLGNCSAERTATVSFIGPLIFFSDASAVTSPGLYTLDVPGKSIPSGFTTNAAPPATYIIRSGTYSMGTTGATKQLAIRAGDVVLGQGLAGLSLTTLGITQAALSVGTLPTLPDLSTGTIPTLHMPDPTDTSGGGIVITQSPFFKGYGGGTVKYLRFTRAAERTASWILFSNSSWTSTPGDYVFDQIVSVNGQGFAIPQVGSSITVTNSNLTISEGFGMNGGTITVTNTPIQLTSTDTSNSSILFSDFDSSTVGTITATIDASSPITIANNVGHLFPLTISNPAWMPNGTFTINSDIAITRTSTTVGLYIKTMSNVALNGKVTVTTATGRPVQLDAVTNLTMPNAANTAKMTATPASALNGGITMSNVTIGAAGLTLTNIDVRKGYLSFDNTNGAPSGPITITGGTVVGDFINPCIWTNLATNVTVTGVTTSNCGF